MSSLLRLDRLPSTPPARSRSRTAGLYRSPAACVALWAVLRLYQLALGCSGEGTDVELYHRYAVQVRSGAASSPDFQPEYPPGALTFFTLPLLLGGVAGYTRTFMAVMAVLDLGICLLVFHRARLRERAPPRAPFLHATIYLLITGALWPVLYARFDLVPAALVLTALHCLDRRRERLSAAILGVAGAIKLWPFALLPLWLVWRVERRPLRETLARAVTMIVCTAAGALLVSVPVLSLLQDRALSSARYHSLRGLEIESTWAALVLVLEHLGLAEMVVEEAYGSTQIAGRLPTILTAVSQPATVVLGLLPVVALIASRRWPGLRAPSRRSPAHPGDGRGVVLEQAALAITLGCMIGAKVLSPQFVLWIAPLLALAVEGLAGAALALLTAGLTSAVYPNLFEALMDIAPGHGQAVLTLAVRDALLVGWYVVAIHRLIGGPAKQRTGGRRLDGGAGTLPGPLLPLRRSRQGRRPGR